MRTSELLPILRSRVQGDLLAWCFLHPEREASVTALAHHCNAAVPTVQHEVARLVDGGLLLDRREGNVRLVRANTTTAMARPLTELLMLSYGPRPVLSEAFVDVPGMVSAFIYGSWARRYEGENGPIPDDIDVLVVGTTDLDLLHDIARDVTLILNRDVNIRRVSPSAWKSANDPFLKTVKSGALVQVHGSGQ
jgi:predicted nucleotidyltransferase